MNEWASNLALFAKTYQRKNCENNVINLSWENFVTFKLEIKVM